MDNENRHRFKLKCAAVDDEPFARKIIADDISKIPFLELKDTLASPLELAEMMKETQIDLIFLDIQMPVVTGIQFLRTLKHPPLVIITTAFEQYALEGYEFQVVDYLLKPYSFERLLKAASRAYDRYVLEKAAAPADGFFFVYSEYKEIKIFYEDVQFVEGLKDYVKIFLKSRPHPVLTRLNLKAMEAKLPDDSFCRVHNSFIVSLSKIESAQKSQVFVGGRPIPVGDKFAEAFQARYKAER
jgi:DNA-binding LytR/AlgR family response regulator